MAWQFRELTAKEVVRISWPFMAAVGIGIGIRLCYPCDVWPHETAYALADAFIVAGIIGIVLELAAAKFLIQKVSDKLAEKLIGRGLPPELQSEIKKIVDTDIVRDHYVKRYRFADAEGGTGTSYENVFLEVRIPYQEADAPGPPARKSYYPAWIDAKSCGNSSYDLKPGKNIKEGVVALKYSGVLLGVGGHMHDYAKGIVLEDVSRKDTVAALDAKVDGQGQLLGMPMVTFFEKGGYKLAAGDVLKTSATYDNPTGEVLRDGAMGIVVGYFVPDDDTQMTSLRRKAKPASRQTAAITRDR